MSLRILHFNIWDIPVSKNRTKRINGICSQLRRNEDNVDIISLVECWMKKDREKIVQAGNDGGLIHSLFFRNGCGFPGGQSSGLVVLSRWPILTTLYHRFSAVGKAHKLLHWDYGMYSGKGIGYAQIQGPTEIGKIDLFISHFVAYYTKRPEEPGFDEYMHQRHLASWESIQFIRKVSRNENLVIMCTDLNASPGSLSYESLVKLSKLRDTWEEAGRPRKSVLPEKLWKAECMGLTCNYPGNCYRERDAHSRIDYIFWKMPTRENSSDGLKQNLLKLKWTERRFTGIDDTEGATVSLSDHAALLACFHLSSSESEVKSQIVRNKEAHSDDRKERRSEKQILEELEKSSIGGISDSRKRRKWMMHSFYVSVAMCLTMFLEPLVVPDSVFGSDWSSFYRFFLVCMTILTYTSYLLAKITIPEEVSGFVYMRDSVRLEIISAE